MPKIDTSRIEGYAEMTVEQKLAAMEAFEYDDNAGTVAQLTKDLATARTSAEDWKKKHDDRLTDEEKNRNAAEEAQKALQEELNTLRREKTVAGYKAKLLAQGYEEKLADDTAAALADGNMEKVFANQQKFNLSREEKWNAEHLGGTPRPPAGTGGEGMTKEKFLRLDTKAQTDYIKDHPNWMNELK